MQEEGKLLIEKILAKFKDNEEIFVSHSEMIDLASSLFPEHSYADWTELIRQTFDGLSTEYQVEKIGNGFVIKKRQLAGATRIDKFIEFFIIEAVTFVCSWIMFLFTNSVAISFAVFICFNLIVLWAVEENKKSENK